MNVLAFDTAGPVIGVALWSQGRVEERVLRVQRGAEALLVPWAEELCAGAGLSLSQVDGVAVAHGPGAFTGLRVGLATAAGLALGLDRPLWGASSLDGRAARVGGDVLVMLDARKSRVYAAWYRGGRVVEGPADLDPVEALHWPGGPCVVTGEGAIVYREQVEAAGGRVVEEADHPGSAALARLAAEAFARGEGRSALDVYPLYLRDADARLPGSGPR